MDPEFKRYLLEYEAGETFTGFYVLRSREIRSRRDGVPYLVLEVVDRSGRLFANVWENAENLYHDLEEDSIIKLQGMIETYRGSPQIVVKKIRMANKDDEYDEGDFLPVSDLDAQTALDRLRRKVKTVKDEHLRQLLENLFADEVFMEKFAKAPGGKLWHHNRIGGLIEHSLAVARLCTTFAKYYPEVNRDLLFAGAILHDVGKIEEFRYDTSFDYTSRGRLVGHIVAGVEMVRQQIDSIEGFPPELSDQLEHLVLSHQAEFGSPVQPSTREAFLLNYADLIDSKMDALRRIGKSLSEGERWKFVKLLGRHIDFGENLDEEV